MSTVLGYLVGERGEFSGVRVAIPEKGVVIGRDPKQVDVVFDHTLVSRRHAQIAPGKDGKLYLIDLQSRNGTLVNSRKITEPVVLATGDKLDFGGEHKAEFVFESVDTTSVSGVLKEAFGETVAPVEWKVGDTILGIYEVTGLLGQGGFGKVYKVHHKNWNMDLAVKSPLPQLFADGKAVENFIREAETWVNLNLHPNIVQCHYVRTIGGIPRIFAEYVPGGTLASWIKNRKLTQLDQILDVAIQFAWGLHAAHEQGIVHQDVKPLNVLMTADGIAKVSDFGLARSKPVTGENAATTPDNMVTMAGMFTTAYCSPEQAIGERLTRKTDIWSWAVSVLEMFTGGIVWQNGLQAPEVLKAYRSLAGPKFMVRMTKDLAKLIEQCLAVHPKDRPRDMREIANALQNVYYSFRGQIYPRPEPKLTQHLADSLNNRAVSLLDLGMKDKALSLLGEALNIEPHNPNTTFNRALLEWRHGEITDDVVDMRLRELGAANPDDAYWKYLFSLFLLEKGDCESAINLLTELLPSPDLHKRVEDALYSAVAWLPQSAMMIKEFHVSIRGATIQSATLSSSGRYAILMMKYLIRSGGGVRLLDTSSDSDDPDMRADNMTAAAFTTDEQVLFLGDDQGSISQLDLVNGCMLRTFKFHSKAVIEISVDRLGSMAVSSSEDGTVAVWRVKDGTEIGRGKVAKCSAICLGSNGQYVAVGNEKGNVSVFDISFKNLLFTLQGNQQTVTKIRTTQDSRFLMSAGWDNRLLVWDVSNRQCVRRFVANSFKPFAMSMTGRAVLTRGEENGFRLWDVNSGRCFWSLPAGRWMDVFSITADGKYGLFGNVYGRLRLYRLPEDTFARYAPYALARVIPSDLSVHTETKYRQGMQAANNAYKLQEWTKCLALLKEMRSLQGCSQRPEAFRLWQRLYRCLPKKTLKGGWEAEDLKFDSWGVTVGCLDGVECAVLGNLLTVTVSRLTDGTIMSSWNLEESLDGLRTGKCGKYLVGWYDSEGIIRVWNILKGTVVSEIKDRFWNWTWSDDERFILTSRYDTLKLWEVKSARCLWTQKADPITCMSFCPEVERVVIGHSNGIISEFDLSSHSCKRRLDLGCGSVRSMLLCGHTPYVLTRGDTGSDDDLFYIYVWDRLTGQQLCKLESSNYENKTACFIGGERYLALGGDSGTIDVFDTNTWKLTRSLIGHQQEVCDLAVSADGAKLFSTDARWNGKVWLLDWDLSEEEPAEWDEDVRSYLTSFLNVHIPYAGTVPIGREPTDEEVMLALTRRGTPVWNETDFRQLLYTLECAGYGWLRSEGVRGELDKMARNWPSFGQSSGDSHT